MKKRVQAGEGEGNEKSAFSEDFLKLQRQYYSATFEERNRLWPEFIRAIREAAPGFIEEFDRAFRSGDYLMAMFEQCMKRAFARHELEAGGKTNALEDTSVFLAVFDEIKQVDSAVRELAYDLATRALFAGLRAGLSPDEIEKLRRQAVRDRALELAMLPKRKSPRAAHATELISEIVKDHPEFNDEEIMDEVENRWRLKGAPCFKPRWLGEQVRRWREDNPDSPPPLSPRRRTYPLKRFRR